MKLDYNLKSVTVFLYVIILVNLILIGCKKDKPDEPIIPEEPPVKIETPVDVAPTTGTRDQLTKDSIFLYARQIYLWWDKVPNYQTFNPRKYADFSDELYAVTRFGLNPATNKPYEFKADQQGADAKSPKYSYISDITQQNPIAYIPGKQGSVDLEGNGYDFGLLISPYGTETAYTLYVQAVYKGSPAEKAGFKRGDRFNKINGQTIGTNFNSEYSFFYDALFSSSTISIEGKTSANSTFNRTINTDSYNSSPIYKDSVYTINASKKVGYMSYARFSNEDNSLPEFTRVFDRFSQAGVTDLIIDLRYNGGGYVSTAEHLLNLIAPASLDGKVMFTEYYNKLMQEGKATILSKQPLLDSWGNSQYQNEKLLTYADADYSIEANTNYFYKEGSLNSVKNIVFIVSRTTASASELVINSLKPHMNVKVVGAQSYGKPVGFFPVRIDNYDLFLSMFETRNSLGQGGYYAGFTPDTGVSTSDDDNPNYDFGDMRENSFLAAYNYLTKGTFTSNAGSATILSKRAEVLNTSGRTFNREFKGMIQTPDKLKLKQ